ncbi:MAG TPA: hypothetical protein VFE62_06235 [Gemmataceae bacterium]|nr:hypothetical protein [Gemmataceae bacterium]
MIVLRALRRVRPQVLASLALTLVLTFVPAAQAGNVFMLSVGVNNAKGHPHLTAPAKDAKDMAAWARTQQSKLFAHVNVVTLTDNSATRKNVLSNLTALKNQARAGDFIIFYDSSHGGDNGRGQYIMCVYDGDLLWNDVLAVLKDSPATKIAILDTCDSGMALSTKAGSPVVLASSRANQNSLDGKSNSLYTQFLLQGLHGKADSNHDGHVTLNEAANYARQQLLNYDKGKKTADQQNSVWSHPANVSANLTIANLTNSNSNSTQTVGAAIYSGKENLAGYGKLSFTLEANNKVIMHDAKSTVHGTYSRSGNQVTLNFPQVQATYHGTMNGFQISGFGSDAKGNRWSFSVNRTN